MCAFHWLRPDNSARLAKRSRRARRIRETGPGRIAQVETLEARTLLSASTPLTIAGGDVSTDAVGEIQGVVFDDFNRDGDFDVAEESIIEQRIVYVDGNNNGVLDTTQTTVSSTTPAAIPVVGTVESDLVVSGLGRIADVNLTLDITHPRDQDLHVRLISPDGLEIRMFRSRGGNGDNFTGTILDDEAAIGIANGNDPFTGSFIPEVALSNFDGKLADGTWTLWIEDQNSSNAGTLNSWSLTFETTSETMAVSDENGAYALTGLAAGTYNVRQILQPFYKQTAPPANAPLVVTLADGEISTGNDLGSVFAKPDIVVQDYATDGNSTLTIDYQIQGDDVAPFAIGLYWSDHNEVDEHAVLLDEYLVSNPSDLSLGDHTLVLEIGADILFPGAGLPDFSSDYTLFIVFDRTDQIIEDDSDLVYDDNLITFASAYHLAGGPVMAFGSGSADDVHIENAGTDQVTLSLTNAAGSDTWSYLRTDVTEFRVRLQGGADDFLNVDAPQAVRVWGGSSNDNITGGPGDDFLDGGFHTNTLNGGDGFDTGVNGATLISIESTSGNPPVVTTTSGALDYIENDPPTAIDPGLLTSDIDSANYTGATVKITTGFAAGQDVLGFTNQNGISGSYNAATGVLTLTGTSSVANYQSALRSVTYFNSSDTPSTAERTVSFSVTDGTQGALAVRKINVTATAEPTDIIVTSATTQAGTSLVVTYTIVGVVPSFQLGFYQSTDTVFGGDTLLDTVTISEAADLTAGVHTKTFTIGNGANVALPGFGATETDVDYHLLVVADPTNVIGEDDANPTAEDNTAVLTGVYRTASSVVYVHGRLTDDSLAINTTGGVSMILNGVTSTFAASAVGSIRVRLHAGSDTVTNTATKTLRIFGGDGIDSLTGPNTVGNWVINGVDTGSLGNVTTFVSVESLIGGTANDTFNFQGTGSVAGLVNGGGGNNTIDYRTLSTAIVVNLTNGTATRTGGVTNISNVVTGSGNDVVTGDTQDNIIHTGAGNDSANGGPGGNDILVGSSGNDTLTTGPGRSILIGGTGLDTLTGGGAEDLLIGSATSHDNRAAALLALMAEWKRTDQTYTQRIDHLRGTTTGGANGSTRLTSTTVPNDNQADQLFGNGSLDWFWGSALEAQDEVAGELFN